MIRDKCPFSAGITVRFDNVVLSRFPLSKLSVFGRNHCPF
jgi:hypothetical protein